MSGFSLRIICGFILSLALVACGGGGGGGSKPKPASSASSSAAPVDTDGDGRPDISDAFPNDAKEWLDTDKDGVGDNGDAFPNDPAETKDSDKDGVGDNKDLFPNDATETVDTDKDGVGDNSDPDPMGQPIPAWTTYQGNAKHTGKVDITLATSSFKQRWSKTLALTSSTPGAAGDGYIFFNNGGMLIALDARNGETLWTQPIGGDSFYSFDQPAYADGIVYVQTGGHENAFLWAFNAATGKLIFQTPLEDQWSSFYAPTIVDGTVYIGGGYYGGMYALDAKTGQQKWWQTLNQYDEFTPAISGNYAIAYTGDYSPKLTVANRLTGNVEFEILDPEFDWGGWSMNLAPVVAGDYVLANYQGRLVAFNLASKTLAWVVDSNFIAQPVISGEQFYINNNGVIEQRTIATGALVSSITNSRPFIGDPLVTNNLLFVRTEQNTYAYQLDTGAQAWTLSGKSGGMLMAEGALVIFTSTGVVTMDLEGDIDADGLPDWWEKRVKKNLDPAADRDGDGLTELAEFNLSTNPLLADTDGDGLSDSEESSGKSSPRNADTDGDGLNDFAEVKTHLTDPTKVDSDGDSLSDSEEVAAGLNPLDGNDALADSDSDGFTNLHEVRASTGINDAASRPQYKDWSMVGGSGQRNNYTPMMLNDSRFSERWTNSRDDVSFYSPVTAGEKLALSKNGNQLVTWDFGTGSESWQLFGAGSLNKVSSANGKLVYFSGNSQSNYAFNVVDATTGNNPVTGLIGVNQSDASPLVDGDTIYVPGNTSTFKAYSLTTGNLRWTSATGATNYYGNNLHMVIGDQLLGVGSKNISVFSTANGSLVRTITVSSGNYSIIRVAAGSKGNIIVQTNDGKLRNIKLADGSQSWSYQECSSDYWAVGNGKVYLLNSAKLCVVDEQMGTTSWTLARDNNYWNTSNILVTASHLFYSDGNTKTYAIDLARKSVSWTIAKGAAQLLMGADGTLYLHNTYSTTAIDTEGDTDADGLAQWWERRYGGDLLASADIDSDGLTNLQEYNNKTNPLVADTDGDGLSDGYELNTSLTNPLVADTDTDGLTDGAEVNTHHTDPLVSDSDADGIDDAREIALGLDPLDEDDATEDSDSDGYDNRDEINSGSDLNDATSKPTVSDWAGQQGNVSRNGFQPYRLDEDNFGLRWSKTFTTSIQPVATGDNRVFVLQGGSYNQSSLFSLNAVDGKQQWKQELGQGGYVGAPAYSSGQVAVLQQASNNTVQRYAADSGVAAAAITLGSQQNTNRAPGILDNIVYTQAYYSGISANRLDTGASVWTSNVSHNGIEFAANENHLFYAYNNQINALNRATGAAAFTISTDTSYASSLTLGSRNNLVVYQNGLASYDLTTRKLVWQLPYEYYNNSPISVGNGQIYQLKNGTLVSRDEVNGKEHWSWTPDNSYLNSNIVVTLSHIFVANNSKTYALSVATGQLVWSYNLGGSLALGADGALYIESERQLVAINLEGDSDSDGMPDWWERHYGLAANDASDAALDLDSDGLANLEEFTLGTYADQADSDGDELTDEEEVNTHLTDPTNSDSDADGMRDDWELDNSFDPLDAADRDLDTDGDTIPNYFEFLVDTDPNDALSAPALFSAGTYSFEDGNLPANWIISADSTDVSIALNTGSQGTKSLQIYGKGDISFVGFFTASDLSLDVKSNCGYAGVEVYIDDHLMAGETGTISQWTTLKTVIPLGLHTVSIRANSYSCNLYVDNVTVAPAKTNTELGIQFVGLNSNQLQFVDASKTVVRSIRAKLPTTNVSAQSLASIGNDKLVVAFSGNNETQLGVLDLATFNWRYFSGLEPLSGYFYSGYNMLVARDNFAYVATQNINTGVGSIARVNLTSGEITHFGSRSYLSLALDSTGYIYAYSSGVVYKFNPTTLALDSQLNTVSAQQILIDSSDRLIVANSNEVIRYNAQRLVDKRVSLNFYARSVAINERDELLVANQNNQLIWYAADWQRFQTLSLPVSYLASFPQPDSDSDGLPDWWELAHGLDIADNADASLDSDGDDLTALQEFGVDTDPALDDTDGDLLTDGDEVNDFGTNPNLVDTDADGLSDSDEVMVHLTNPLAVDSDADLVSDFLELTQFLTNPNDAASKPATLTNFIESFESTYTGWVVPAQASAGWTLVADAASNGSKSLRADVTGSSDEFAQIEWNGLFGQSTLTFDAKVTNLCCGSMRVYVDGVERVYVGGYGQWNPYSLQLAAGFHSIRFEYQNYYSSISTDTVWIDNLRVQ